MEDEYSGQAHCVCSLSGIMKLIRYVRCSGLVRPDVVGTQEPTLGGEFVSRQHLFAAPFQKLEFMALNKTGGRIVVRVTHATE